MPFCRFCFDNKIDGPHNHFLREKKDPLSQITCPLLLNTTCIKCNKKGHTAKYCKMNATYTNVKMTKEYDQDGFMIIKNKNRKANKNTTKERVESENMFEILCEESDNNKTESKNEQNNELRSMRPIGISWADWEEIEE